MHTIQYSARSTSGLFSDRLHQVLRSLILPTYRLTSFIFTTIWILLSYSYDYHNPPAQLSLLEETDRSARRKPTTFGRALTLFT